ncbi:integral membrane protein [Rutstroemia sp. NJR-2017a WRK4]|nr:integral membrane protein [Rutstroemia sp. NJR-2017a WRK4]
MARASPLEPSSPSPTTENPVVAVARKVKADLRKHQQPTIRIYRDSSSNDKRAPLPRGSAQQIHTGQHGDSATQPAADSPPSNNTSFSNRMRSLFGSSKGSTNPEVSTLSTLTNVQNSLFVPSMGKIVNRQPTYRLSDRPNEARTLDRLKIKLRNLRSTEKEADREIPLPKLEYAVLPDGETLAGWTIEEINELDDRVRHELHSRRAKMRRALKGFGHAVADGSHTALGLFITVYATLITLFGAAWVLFLIGWISIGSRKAYVVNVVDNVLVALFAIIGDGLAPFRAVDTYHMAYIVHYHRKTWKQREKLGLPELWDHNDLPDQRKEHIVPPPELDLESLVARKMPRGLARVVAPRIPKRYADRMMARNKIDIAPNYDYTVLTEEEQNKLEFHERKFSKSHTFYKPHETETHYAFPLKLLFAVVILLDLHSCLQISLGACTWGISYKTRPFALTTVILCFSITCNIMGGVLISIGDKRTRKHDVIERMMKQELTGEVIEDINTRRLKEAEERGEIDPIVRKRMEEEKEQAENEEVKKSWKSVPSLPKTLLGKGEDHRQPSLPQEARTRTRGEKVLAGFRKADLDRS